MLASFISLPSPFSLSSVFLPNPRSHIRTIQLGGPGTAVSGGCGRSPDAQRTVSQDQRICSGRIIAAAHNSLKDGLDGLEVCSWCRSSLSQRPLRIPAIYCHLMSSLVSVYHLQRLALWFHAQGWTTKFRSQRTSHTEPSANSTIRSPE